jgi:hypothetical protein
MKKMSKKKARKRRAMVSTPLYRNDNEFMNVRRDDSSLLVPRRRFGRAENVHGSVDVDVVVQLFSAAQFRVSCFVSHEPSKLTD